MAPLAEVPCKVPPELALYQLIVFPAEVAFKLDDWPAHIALAVAVTELGNVLPGVTACDFDAVAVHPADEVAVNVNVTEEGAEEDEV